MLDQLTSLAQERCPETRKKLLSAVADLFVEDESASSETTIALFEDVVERLLDDVDGDGRAEFSRTIAPCDRTPVKVVERLAREEDIAISGPVLRQSPALSDDVLVDIAGTRGQAHLYQISQRDTLAPEVTEVIVERGDQVVVRTVAANSGARFNERTFDRLAERASGDEKLIEHLFTRADVPQGVADKLLGGMSLRVRERLRKLAETSPTIASHLVGRAAAKADQDTAEAPQGDTLDARALARSVSSGQRSIDSVVNDLVRQNRAIDLAFVLSKLADTPIEDVRAALSKTDMSAAAVLCKRLGVSSTAFAQVAGLIGASLALPDSHIDHFAREYDKLDVATAERVSRFVAARRSAIASSR